ncbi:MAG: type IX secretion system membrane protein PorP/SprF [Bacteroidales bacterium]|jgi:type IX secretion system PorP/SprF family membrane protein
MTRKLAPLMAAIFFLSARASSQMALSGLNYQMTMISNPAIAGSEGDGMIRLSYVDLYPGNNFNLHSVAASYDGYFPSLHGGAAAYLTDDYLGGLVNDIRGGLSYSYYFRAGRDMFITGGLSASFYHRGFNAGGAVLPDQIDPINGVIYPSGETLPSTGRTMLDLGTGFLLITGNFFGGVAVTHLAEPDFGNSALAGNKLYRTVLIHAAGDIGLNRENSLRLRPLGKIEISSGMMSAGAGAALETSHFTFSSVVLADNEKDIDLQAGFSVTAGKMVIFYNYRFNIVSGENLLPLSLMHNTGIAVSLNNVDKRKTVRTIKFPEL